MQETAATDIPANPKKATIAMKIAWNKQGKLCNSKANITYCCPTLSNDGEENGDEGWRISTTNVTHTCLQECFNRNNYGAEQVVEVYNCIFPTLFLHGYLLCIII